MWKRRCMLWILAILGPWAIGVAHGADKLPLTIVFAEGLEPLCWEQDGKPMGIQPEIAQYVLSKLNVDAKFVFLPWMRAQSMVKSGEADVMMTTPSKARFEFAVFGKEMTTPNSWNVFVQKKNLSVIAQAQKLVHLEDLKQFKVLDFVGNGWTAAYMPQAQGYQIVSAPNMEQLVKMLAVGRGDLTINSSTSMRWFLHKLNLKDQIEEVDMALPGTRFHMTFQVSRKSKWVERGLVKALDNELKKMKDSGEWINVLRKYRDPYASGRPFKSELITDGFYTDYANYPSYHPER